MASDQGDRLSHPVSHDTISIPTKISVSQEGHSGRSATLTNQHVRSLERLSIEASSGKCVWNITTQYAYSPVCQHKNIRDTANYFSHHSVHVGIFLHRKLGLL